MTDQEMRAPATRGRRAALPGALIALALGVALTIRLSHPVAAEQPRALPAPAVDEPAGSGPETAVFAGGCFWGVQGVFQHVKGVASAVSGYSGGDKSAAQYETVSTGTTGHAESVQVTYDPSKVSYDDLLKVFFFVAHDPTELNRQGPDSGTQYRSSIFYMNDAQKKMADDYIAQLDQQHAFSGPIVTKVVPFTGFYPAEDYHQNYLELHPDQPYIVYNDLPKLEQFQKDLPGLYERQVAK